jgi:hypothetical protein
MVSSTPIVPRPSFSLAKLRAPKKIATGYETTDAENLKIITCCFDFFAREIMLKRCLVLCAVHVVKCGFAVGSSTSPINSVGRVTGS